MEMWVLADCLSHTDDVEPIVAINRDLDRIAGISVVILDEAPLLRRVPVLGAILDLAFVRISSARLLDRVAPQAIVLSDDRRLPWEIALIRAARCRAIPSVIVPFGAWDPAADAAMRRSRRSVQLDSGGARHFRRLIGRLWPRQVHRHSSGHDLLFYSGVMTLVLAALRMLPSDPWYLGASGCDIVTTFDQADRARLLARGASADRVLATGQPSLDDLHHAAQRRDEVRAYLGVAHDEKLIVCAVPHLAEHGDRPWRQHLEETAALFDDLADTGAHVALSLHPRSDPADYQGLAEGRGLAILGAPLRMTLPAADAFVATASSTIRWAAALGIPSVVIAPWDTETIADDLVGVEVVRDRAAVAGALDRALGLERGDVSRGALDGRSGERVVAIIRSVFRTADGP